MSIFLLTVTTISVINAQVDTTQAVPQKKQNSFTSVFYGDPGKAALYSLLIPGGGQLYNKRYWKAPLIIAGEGFAAYNLINKISTFQDRDQCWKSFIDNPQSTDSSCQISDTSTISSLSESFTRRQSARSQKEWAWVIMAAAHLMNVIEAFVDRHLINFDTSEDLSMFDFQSQTNTFDPVVIPIFKVSIPLSN